MGWHGGHYAARAFWEWHTAHCSSLGSLNLGSPPSPQLIPTTLLGKHLCSFPIFTQSGDAWSWGKERAEWVRWLFLASLYRLKPMRTFLCVQVAIHGITVPATLSTQAWPVYLSVWCPTLPSFRRLIDCLSLSLLTTQVQWPSSLWTRVLWEQGVQNFHACNFRVLYELRMVEVHYLPPNVPFGLFDRKVLLLRSVIIKINAPPNNRAKLTCLCSKFPISYCDFAMVSSGNQILNEKQLAQTESGRNTVILVKLEKDKCFKKHVVHKHYLCLPLLMSAYRS